MHIGLCMIGSETDIDTSPRKNASNYRSVEQSLRLPEAVSM
jgi:hypothetical protein